MSFSLYVLKSHESFTYVSPDVFFASSKSLIFNALQETVRVSFSAPNASRECGAFCYVLAWLVCAARLLYKSGLYRKASAERRLSRKPRPDAHFDVRARLVHRFIDSAGQIHLEETGIALIPGVDEYEIVK